jgi:hypothetical protein
MALETLKGIKEIDGFKVLDMGELSAEKPELFNESGAMDWKVFERDIRPNNFIYVRHDKNSISFTVQKGPIKEAGINGVQVDTLIETARIMLVSLSKQFPCRENSIAITKLQEALFWLDARRKDRESRGVEGHNKLYQNFFNGELEQER